jgi:hypothetical protein
MQTWVVKRLNENVNSQRNVQLSSENMYVLEDFFCALDLEKNNTFLPHQF